MHTHFQTLATIVGRGKRPEDAPGRSARLCMTMLVWMLVPATLFAATSARQLRIKSRSGVQVAVDVHGNIFEVSVAKLHWTVKGILGGTNSGGRAKHGSDRVGAYEEISFSAEDNGVFRRSIRVYENRPVVIFTQQSLHALKHVPADFPVFNRFPDQLSCMTYSEREFGAPPVFRPFPTAGDSLKRVHSGPVLLFDLHDNACIVSPAGSFMVAAITENGSQLACGVNAGLTGIPPGFTTSTILVAEAGINRVWEDWGHALTDRYAKKRPPNDADVGLKYLSYWTDNGATYYYAYDTTKGYLGTLLGLKKRFDEEHLPMRSMQLDSWWYPKGRDNPDGTVDPAMKRVAWLPDGSWNHYGGMLEYSASPDLFPGGLKAFHDSLGLPLTTHSRWISSSSPYRSKYRISGIAAVDRTWWSAVMKSIASWGVTTYEQDWLDRIYRYSPEFSSTPNIAEDFMDEMAGAAKKAGITLQYCMPLPRHYLQGGAHYSNLTTIRVSGDRFERSRWKEFLYGSRLASALGVWPWSDVFMSKETPNILLATLSAGIVGIGDSVGTEDPGNILQSVRADGVIIKPDVPLVPTDWSYLNDAEGNGVRTALTYTDHGDGFRTFYLFAATDTLGKRLVKVPSAGLGVTKTMVAYDYFRRTGSLIQPGDSVSLELNSEGWCYYVISPMAKEGFAVIGDQENFVTAGKERIERLHQSDGSLGVVVLAAKGDSTIALCGYARKMPIFFVYDGYVNTTQYSPETHIFRIEIKPQEDLQYKRYQGDPVRRVKVVFKR